jgi:hypothetical protein
MTPSAHRHSDHEAARRPPCQEHAPQAEWVFPTPSGLPATLRCRRSLAVTGSIVRPPRAARWGASRPSGWPQRQPGGADRSVRGLDRLGARSQAAGQHHSRHGQFQEPDVRRAGRFCSNSLAIWSADAYARDLGAVEFELDPRSKVGLSGSSSASTKFGNENSDAESQTFVQVEPLDHLIMLGG